MSSSEIRVNTIKSKSGLSTITLSDTGNVISGITTVQGNFYVSSGSFNADITGNINSTGISTFSGGVQLGTGVTISSPTSNEFTVSTNGSERVRVGSAGTVTIGSSTIASGLEPYAQLQVSGSVGGIVINSENVSASDYSRLMFTKQNATGNEGLIRYNTNDYHMSFWTNADEKLRIDASGRVTMPYQPGFVAYMSGSQTGYNMTSGNTSVVIYNGTSINTGNHYSTSTGLFTAPVTGWYSFSAGAVVSTGLIADEAWWIINGARNITPTMYTPVSGTNTPKATDIVYLAANDTIGLHLYDSSGETNATLSTNFYHTYFKGYLLG